jgi:hypothetical protein
MAVMDQQRNIHTGQLLLLSASTGLHATAGLYGERRQADTRGQWPSIGNEEHVCIQLAPNLRTTFEGQGIVDRVLLLSKLLLRLHVTAAWRAHNLPNTRTRVFFIATHVQAQIEAGEVMYSRDHWRDLSEAGFSPETRAKGVARTRPRHQKAHFTTTTAQRR